MTNSGKRIHDFSGCTCTEDKWCEACSVREAARATETAIEISKARTEAEHAASFRAVPTEVR